MFSDRILKDGKYLNSFSKMKEKFKNQSILKIVAQFVYKTQKNLRTRPEVRQRNAYKRNATTYSTHNAYKNG